jgi:hypothetical protein
MSIPVSEEIADRNPHLEFEQIEGKKVPYARCNLKTMSQDNTNSDQCQETKNLTPIHIYEGICKKIIGFSPDFPIICRYCDVYKKIFPSTQS